MNMVSDAPTCKTPPPDLDQHENWHECDRYEPSHDECRRKRKTEANRGQYKRQAKRSHSSRVQIEEMSHRQCVVRRVLLQEFREFCVWGRFMRVAKYKKAANRSNNP